MIGQTRSRTRWISRTFDVLCRNRSSRDRRECLVPRRIILECVHTYVYGSTCRLCERYVQCPCNLRLVHAIWIYVFESTKFFGRHVFDILQVCKWQVREKRRKWSGEGHANEVEKRYLVEEPRWEHHLEQIVNYQRVLQLKGFSILHQLRAQNFYHVHVAQTDEQGGERWTHHEPVRCPLIWKISASSKIRECLFHLVDVN